MTSDPQNESGFHQSIAGILKTEFAPGDSLQFRVVSNSMGPLILRGELVMIEKTAWDQIQPGDLVLIQRESDYLTHRLILKSQKKGLTKGDKNLMPDPPAAPDDIIGRVFCLQRGAQTIDLRTGKWRMLNRLLAKLSYLEWKAYSIQRFLRWPFRLAIKLIQKLLMPKRKSNVDTG